MRLSILNLIGRIPIRVILIIPFVIQILIIVGLIGYLSLRSGQQAVNNVTTQLVSKSITGINLRVLNYLNTPHLFHQVNAAAVQSGDLDLNDFPQLETYFWHQTGLEDAVPYVYWGNESGEFIGVQRLLDGRKLVKVRNEDTAPIREIYSLNDQGVRLSDVPDSSKEYDPRVRPWYEVAANSGASTWTAVYPSASIQNLIITPVIPIYDHAKQLAGVFAIDLSLAQISEFLQGLEISQSGHAFIMERSGEIIASSTDELPYIDDDGQQQRLSATDSQQPIIRETSRYLVTTFGDLTQIEGSQQFSFDLQGIQHLGEITVLQDGRGLDWLVVVVIPADDFMGQITANTQATILLSAIALIVAILVGLLTAYWVVQPILRLNRAAKSLAQGQWEQTLASNRQDELGELAQSFSRMAKQLQASFATLKTSEEKYRSLFEDSKDAIFISMASGEVIDMNPAGLELFGYPVDTVPSLHMQEMYANPTDRDKFRSLIEQEGMVRDFEVTYLTKDGHLINCLETATLGWSEKEKISTYQGIIRDITEQKRMEQERLHFSGLQRELVIANEMQQSLLPPAKPDWPSLDVVCYSQPTQDVGGDFYVYHTFESTTPDNGASTSRYALAVGDVSGKGVPAALLMAVSLASFQSTVVHDYEPAQLMAYLNEAIMTYTSTNRQNCAFAYAEISRLTPNDNEKRFQIKAVNAGGMSPM
ncbi:MAG: cache domain-containing protein, partial [Chloroflexota bacterium]